MNGCQRKQMKRTEGQGVSVPATLKGGRQKKTGKRRLDRKSRKLGAKEER